MGGNTGRGLDVCTVEVWSSMCALLPAMMSTERHMFMEVVHVKGTRSAERPNMSHSTPLISIIAVLQVSASFCMTKDVRLVFMRQSMQDMLNRVFALRGGAPYVVGTRVSLYPL